MRKLKLVTIVGTRPEIIRLSECIKAFDDFFDHILIHTGQNWDYTLNEIFFKELNLKEPDIYLDAVGNDLGETIGNIISKSYKSLSEIMPDAVLILGDTNSALAALPAKRLKIPVFHMEAGNRCFDENLPEEINRRIVDHISDINLAYTEHARRYLIAEGCKKEFVFVTGSPMREVINKHKESIYKSDILKRLSLEQNEYFLLSAHREDTIDDRKNLQTLVQTINFLAEKFKLPIIYSMHPRSKQHIEKYKFKFNDLVRSVEPMGFLDYNKLQINSKCVISDSGTLPEEANILGFPSVSIRNSTERPESFDKATMILSGIEKDSFIQSIDLEISMWDKEYRPTPVLDYQDDNVSNKVVKIIQSFTHVVNEMVWRK